MDVDFVQPPLHLEDVLGVALNVGGLPLEPAGRLMDHDPRVRQGEAAALFAGGQQKRAHRGRLPDAHRRHFGADELHRVVDRKARRHHAARRIDVEGDLLLRVFRLEKQQLGDHQRRRHVLDRPDHEDDALAQEARENVERAFAARRLLDHDRHEIVGVIVDRIAHWLGFPQNRPSGRRPKIGARRRPEKRRRAAAASAPVSLPAERRALAAPRAARPASPPASRRRAASVSSSRDTLRSSTLARPRMWSTTFSS